MSNRESILVVDLIVRNPSVTVADAASILGVSRQRIDQRLANGTLKPVNLFGERRVSLSSIVQVLALKRKRAVR